MSSNGIRVVMVMNRKGGCGKSTLVKGLASAAAERGETVTIFDTDQSQSSYLWMCSGQERGNWDPLVSVIPSMDAGEVAEAIDQIYTLPDQEHLVLIDSFGGGAAAQDEMVLKSHLVAVPTKLSRSDVSETRQTLLWHARLKERVPDPDAVPPISVVINAVPYRRSEAEEAAIVEMVTQMPTLPEPVMQRAAYLRLDLEGLLGPIRDSLSNPGVARHLSNAVAEMDMVLTEIDQAIRGEADHG